MFKFNRLHTAIIGACVFLAPHVSHAGIFDDDEARKAILDLRAKIEALTAKVDSRLETKADKVALLELVNEIELIRTDMSRLRGQIEVLSNEISTTQKRQQDFYTALENRIKALEPKKITVDGREAIVENFEQRNFDAAMSLFKSGDYKGAANAFNGFVSAYPQSVYQPVAQYWLGNSYYAQRDCKSMIPVMQQMAKSFPDHPKAPEALLNIAGCHLEAKDKVAAKKILQIVVNQYEGTDAALAAKDRLKTIK